MVKVGLKHIPKFIAKVFGGLSSGGLLPWKVSPVKIYLPMVLSDRSIKEEIAKGRIIIDPLEENNIQPASVDLRLGKKILVFKTWHPPFYIDVKKEVELTEEVELEDEKPFLFQPGEFILASTLEYIALPNDIVGRLEGKSSLGRIGLLIHSTAGYIDPGWKGNLTLELTNSSKLPITLYYKMKIGQISFLRLSTPAERIYGDVQLGSKYQGDRGPTPSRYYREFESETKSS